ncbi:hypothetical protein KAU43_04350 [candidate division WOR-3 bacterium]|nr:hypothetical protein [candidate division WOR-3 bacterium]
MKKLLIVLIALTLVFTGCSLFNKPPEKPAAPKTIDVSNVKGPSSVAIAADTSGHAATASAMVTSISGLATAFSSLSQTPSDWDNGTYDSGTWTWSDGYGLYSIKWEAVLDGDYYNWAVYIDGNFGNQAYNNFLYMDGRTRTNGHDGHWTIYDDSIAPPYDDNGHYPVFSWQWDINADETEAKWWLYNGALNDELVLYYHYTDLGGGDADFIMKNEDFYYRVHSEQNGSSGWVKYYETGSPDPNYLVWYVYWDATGHGGWEEWSGGTKIHEGTW